VFTGFAPPLHSGIYVSGHFNDLAHVFLNTVTYLYLGLFILCMQKFKVPKVN